MAHAQKPDFVFRRNGRVHLNRRGRKFSRLLAAEVCASAGVMMDKPCSEVVRRVLATHSIRQFPLRFPSRASPCCITFQLVSNNLRVTPRGSRKKPNAVRSPTCRLSTSDVNSHMPCCVHAVLCRGLSLSERHGRSTAWAWHGMAWQLLNTAALCKSNGKDTVAILGGTAWTQHAMCELALRGSLACVFVPQLCGLTLSDLCILEFKYFKN